MNIVQDICDQPYGCRDFTIEDCDGYRLCFGEPMGGTIRTWWARDGRYRREEEVGPYTIIETFDGTVGMIRRGSQPAQVMDDADLARARSLAFANYAAVLFVALPEYRRGTVITEGDGTIVLRPEGGNDWYTETVINPPIEDALFRIARPRTVQ